MIYFIQEDGLEGYIKIGFTRDSAERRRDQLQMCNARALRVLAEKLGDEAEERREHARFRHLRIRGEWFIPGPDLIAYIDSRKRIWRRQIEREYAREQEKAAESIARILFAPPNLSAGTTSPVLEPDPADARPAIEEQLPATSTTSTELTPDPSRVTLRLLALRLKMTASRLCRVMLKDPALAASFKEEAVLCDSTFDAALALAWVRAATTRVAPPSATVTSAKEHGDGSA